MTVLRELFQKEQAGLTVYSPDCAQSRLWGNLDHAIHEATGFGVVYRQWIIHDINTIMRFYNEGDEEPPPIQDTKAAARRYEDIPAEDLQYGHLVVKLFLSGPALLTIWRGDQAIETLLKLKGATHPAEAPAESIRGRFWCDNAVCNLIHTSDDYMQAERELKVVNLSHLLDEEMTPKPLINPVPPPTSYIAHSGIAVVCDLVKRMFTTTDDVRLPSSGDAKETQQTLVKFLQETATTRPTVADFINAYLAGDLVTVTTMMRQMPVTKWEHFVTQCGVVSRDKWHTGA